MLETAETDLQRRRRISEKQEKIDWPRSKILAVYVGRLQQFAPNVINTAALPDGRAIRLSAGST